MKSAEAPKLIETMSLDSLRFPNRPSSSLCHRTRDRTSVEIQIRTRGHFPISAPRRHQGCDCPPQPPKTLPVLRGLRPNRRSAPMRICSHPNMSSDNTAVPPKLCGKCNKPPSQNKMRAQAKPAIPSEHLERSISSRKQ